ncbi:hypothetical protein ACQP2K_37465 [Microbispora siamensis]
MPVAALDALLLLEGRAERLAETRAGLEAALAAQAGDLPRVAAIRTSAGDRRLEATGECRP